MIAPILATLSICPGLLHAMEPEPIVLKATRSRNEWSVPVEVDGKSMILMLDDAHGATQFSKSTVSHSGLDLAAEHEFAVGKFVLARVTVSPDQTEDSDHGLNGALRLDVLGNCALGFDLLNSTVTLWPNGGADPEAAEAWVKGGSPWSPSDKAPRAARFNLEGDPDGLPSVRTQYGGASALSRILLSSSNPYLPPSIVSALPHFVTQSASGEVAVAGLPEDLLGAWGLFLSGHGPYDEEEPDEPCIGIGSLNSPRVVIDFAHKSLFVQEPSAQTRAEIALSTALTIPLRKDGAKMVVGPLGAMVTSWADGRGLREGDEVLDLHGATEEDLLKVLSAPVGSSATEVGALISKIEAHPRTLKVLRDGKKTDLYP